MMDSNLLWTLVLIQLVMGAFDVLFHHEFTERLSWKASAKNELLLHAARNCFYGVLFLIFAWSEPRGLLALALAGILIAEIVITLWDFVEEDRTRQLPASERVLHTLLAINYGAIMALLLPVLVDWSRGENALLLTSYGWGSVVLSFAAVGVFIFAAHDVLASRRVRALTTALRSAGDLAKDFDTRQRIVVLGGTGFVGSRLVNALSNAGHAVIVQTRDPAKAKNLKPPFTVVQDLRTLPKDLKVDAVVNLAGEPVATGLWTRRKAFRIYRSRLKAARDAGRFIRHLNVAPKVLISASAVGYYGSRDGEALTEADMGLANFSNKSTRAIEAAADRAAGMLCRSVKLRIGLVLGIDGGLLANLLPPFDWGVGGPIGSGKQWMSWIERDDLVRLILFAVRNEDLDGAVNATAPNPVTNRVFAKSLGQALGRPAFLPLPSFVPKYILGQMGRELLLEGQRVLPQKAKVCGFQFDATTLDQALSYCLGTKRDVALQQEPVRPGLKNRLHGA